MFFNHTEITIKMGNLTNGAQDWPQSQNVRNWVFFGASGGGLSEWCFFVNPRGENSFLGDSSLFLLVFFSVSVRYRGTNFFSRL